MLHHLRCPSCFHDLDLPIESEQPGRLLTPFWCAASPGLQAGEDVKCYACGWSVNMFGKIDMLQIPQSEIDQLLWRSLGRKMEDSIQILAEHRAFQDISEFREELQQVPFLLSRMEVHDLALLMDFTGNIDAPLP